MQENRAGEHLGHHIAEAVMGGAAIVALLGIGIMLTGMAAPKIGEGLIHMAASVGVPHVT